MFADQLHRDEGVALLRLVAWIAAADGFVDATEERFLRDLRARMALGGVSIAVDPAQDDLESLCAALPAGPARRIAYVELVNAARADGVLHPKERMGLDRVATALGLDAETRRDIERWLEEGRAWERRGRGIVLGPRG